MNEHPPARSHSKQIFLSRIPNGLQPDFPFRERDPLQNGRVQHLLNEFTPEEIQTAQDVRRRINERLALGNGTDERAEARSREANDKIVERNRQNAQSSTGPRTEEGKARSSRNAVRHGLSGAFCVHHSESEEEFLHLRTSLLAEHLPATPTEILLVENMARHEWLTQRALRMQENLIAPNQWSKDFNKDLALYLRYQTTHQRAFHKCLADLQKAQKLRKQNELAESGFVSQNGKRKVAQTVSSSANAAAPTAQIGLVSQNKPQTDNQAPATAPETRQS